jgi:phosphatidylglycerol---prolipoprotein diacylglyceryl transferase
LITGVIEIGLNPVAFLQVGWYGICLALGVAIVVAWGIWQSRKKDARFTGDQALTAALVGIPSGVIVSKLLHVIDNIVIAKFHPEIPGIIDYTQYPLQIFSGYGLTIEGAVLGAALGIWIYSRYSKLNYGALVDAIAPSIILAQAVGRIGCLINGCCYGMPTDLPWALTYVDPHPLAGIVTGVHPTQLYEIIFNLIVFGILFALRNKFKPAGSLFAIYLSFYAAWRIGIDFIRDGNPFLFGLHQAQVVGAGTRH